MKVFLFWIFNLLFWLAMGCWALIIISLFTSGEVTPEVIVALGIIVGVPTAFIVGVRQSLLRTFEVRKYRSIRRRDATLQRVRKQQEKKRNSLSQQAEHRNTEPMVELTRKELHLRQRDITPNIMGSTEQRIVKYSTENAVASLGGLYEVIINTPPTTLNQALEAYLKELGG